MFVVDKSQRGQPTLEESEKRKNRKKNDATNIFLLKIECERNQDVCNIKSINSALFLR